MYIDFHTHIRMDTLVTERYWKGWIGIAHTMSGIPKEKIRSKIERTIMTMGEDDLIKTMDEAGVDKAVVVGVDWGKSNAWRPASHYSPAGGSPPPGSMHLNLYRVRNVCSWSASHSYKLGGFMPEKPELERHRRPAPRAPGMRMLLRR